MKQILPDDVVACIVYTRLSLINKEARLFHDLEIEEVRFLNDNASLINSVRNLTNHPVYGLEAQMNRAMRVVLATPPRGGMCARVVLLTVGRLQPVLRNRQKRVSDRRSLLAICRPSGCTVASGVVVVVGGGVCNRSQMRTSKCTCLIFGVSVSLDPG